jgi:hypothetical protein
MLFGQLSVLASPVSSPKTITGMLEFAAPHQIKPLTENCPNFQVNLDNFIPLFDP